MKMRGIVATLAGALLCSVVASHQAHAEILYDGVGFLEGTQAFSDSFSVASPGTLTVTLGDVGWPQPLSSLNMLVSSANGALGPQMGIGTSSFNVSSGNIFAQWFGTAAAGGLNAGVYSLEIQYQPNVSTGSPVPLPTSIGLLLSGIGLLLWQRRTRGADEPAGGQAATAG
jgi:hypothetical protein